MSMLALIVSAPPPETGANANGVARHVIRNLRRDLGGRPRSAPPARRGDGETTPPTTTSAGAARVTGRRPPLTHRRRRRRRRTPSPPLVRLSGVQAPARTRKSLADAERKRRATIAFGDSDDEDAVAARERHERREALRRERERRERREAGGRGRGRGGTRGGLGIGSTRARTDRRRWARADAGEDAHRVPGDRGSAVEGRGGREDGLAVRDLPRHRAAAPRRADAPGARRRGHHLRHRTGEFTRVATPGACSTSRGGASSSTRRTSSATGARWAASRRARCRRRGAGASWVRL